MATVMSSQLLTKLELENLDLILREKRVHWFGHVSILVVQAEQVDGRRG